MPTDTWMIALREYVATLAPGKVPTWIKIELENDPERCISMPVPPLPLPVGKVSGDDLPAAEVSPPVVEVSPATDEELTECERDLVEILDVAGRRMTGDEIKDELQKAGKLHGDSTITKALPRLVHQKKRLTNRRDSYGRGYGLADWS